MTSTRSKNKFGVSSASDAFRDLLFKIDEEGLESSPRGHAVKELFLETVDINPLFPIPSFESRPFNWKYLAGEMAWYLKGSRNIEYINNFSNFWKGIANEDGTVNSNYGNLLLYSDQFRWAYDSLVKDQNSRQAICFVSRPDFQYEGNKDFVCTVYLNFWIRNGELNMKVQMRSNDLFYGYTYDVPFFSIIMQTMWHNLRPHYPDLKIGKYFHCADNIHYYERHFEMSDKIRSEENPENPLFFYSKGPIFTVERDGLRYSDETLSFIEEIDNLVEAKNVTHENCKQALSKLFIIQ